MVGFHDAFLSGWFRINDDGELFPGFPVGPEDVVLDVGCGQGAYSALCGRTGALIISVDIDADNVAETGRRVAETAARAFTPIVGDANPLPLEDNSVTKVISTEVIEHVDDPAVFLRELARVGKPGARYLLAVPDAVQERIQRQVAPPEFFVKPKPGEGAIRGLSSGHLRTIGRDEFERMVTSAGFGRGTGSADQLLLGAVVRLFLDLQCRFQRSAPSAADPVGANLEDGSGCTGWA